MIILYNRIMDRGGNRYPSRADRRAEMEKKKRRRDLLIGLGVGVGLLWAIHAGPMSQSAPNPEMTGGGGTTYSETVDQKGSGEQKETEEQRAERIRAEIGDLSEEELAFMNEKGGYLDSLSDSQKKTYNEIIDGLSGSSRSWLTDEHKAAFVGNAIQESSLDPTNGKNGYALGLWQHEGWRRDNLEKRSDHLTVQGQINFVFDELDQKEKNSEGLSIGWKPLAALKESKSVKEATLAFSDEYEKPGNPKNNWRVGYATLTYANMNDLSLDYVNSLYNYTPPTPETPQQ